MAATALALGASCQCCDQLHHHCALDAACERSAALRAMYLSAYCDARHCPFCVVWRTRPPARRHSSDCFCRLVMDVMGGFSRRELPFMVSTRSQSALY